MTQITKHTPEPWYVDDNGRVRAKSNDAIICEIDDGCTLHGRENFTTAQMAQHAKLIAAAPEMVEALKEAEMHLDWCKKHHDQPDNRLILALEKAQAALAKAGIQ